jgi:hypothetical protein
MKSNRSGRVDIGALWAALPIALAACAGDTLSLGVEGAPQVAPEGSRCAASPTLVGTVVVNGQADLDVLAGCEAIEGNLEIAQFAGADLSPLASLRSVAGDLNIGKTPSVAEFWTVLEGGWLESLEGLEALERVGALALENVNAPSLRPLENLHHVNANATGSWRAGELVIERAHHLVDLSGLEKLQGVTRLVVIDNDALESLDGLSPPFRLEEINLGNNPRLANLDALANVRFVDFLQIHTTGVRDLTALSELGVRETINIAYNPELVDISALPLWPVRSFGIENNPKLDGTLVVPDRAGVFVARNAELDRVVLEELHGSGDSWGGGALETRILIGDNQSLSSIDLGALERCAELLIEGNGNLSQLEMPSLVGAVALSVRFNPRLSTAALAGVQSLERRISDNAD